MVKKVNAIDSSGLIKKTDYDTTIKNIEGKMPSITNLVTTAAFTGVENKILNVRDLDIKTDYDAKPTEIEVKYFTTSDYNKFANDILDTKIKNKKISQ